ncbi:hypothetical protein GGX14DRAFT_341488, partial [Mycena pura]
MVGCSLLVQISEALMEAKGNSSIFGGINVIFAGDFAQLPPVGMKSLYATIKTKSSAASQKKGQQNIAGKLLWLSVKTVVILKRVERVRGQSDGNNAAVQFVDLLSRLRMGKCTENDFELLNSRLLSRQRPDWNAPGFQNIPVIVPTNAIKDALNERAARVYAARTGNTLDWYYVRD